MSTKENDNFHEHQKEGIHEDFKGYYGRHPERFAHKKTFVNKSAKIKNSLEKAKGGMIGELKRTMKDKDLKRDHYADFKKQHNIK